jgi:hypothetical protein
MECERRRRALQGDVAASVASEPFMSTFPSYSEAGFKDEDRRAVTGRGGGRSGDTEKSCDDDAPRSGDQVGPHSSRTFFLPYIRLVSELILMTL